MPELYSAEGVGFGTSSAANVTHKPHYTVHYMYSVYAKNHVGPALLCGIVFTVQLCAIVFTVH